MFYGPKLEFQIFKITVCCYEQNSNLTKVYFQRRDSPVAMEPSMVTASTRGICSQMRATPHGLGLGSPWVSIGTCLSGLGSLGPEP